MNRGLLSKGFREVLPATLLCGLGVLIFHTIAAYVFWLYQEEVAENIGEIEIFRNFLSSIVGGDVAEQFGPEALNAIPWAHPLFLSLFWAYAIYSCTRIPAGEIDRGTVDILLALPVSRLQIFSAEAMLCLTGGLVILGAALTGNFCGQLLIPEVDRPGLDNIARVLVNLYLLFTVIAGMTTLFSALADRRGRAVSSVVGVLLVLFVWNFFAEYWEPAKSAGFLNILSYYKPMPILDKGTLPIRDLLVLIGTALPLWSAAAYVFHSRDVNTV